MKIIHFASACALCVLGGSLSVNAQTMTESDYRSRWTSTENSFAEQHSAEVRTEEKKKDVEIYLQMGNDYLDKKDYATALMCFRTVIELENELGVKGNVEFAQAQIARVEQQMKQEIKQDLNNVFGKSWPRREEGLKRILDRMPSSYTQKWAEEQEQRRIAAIEAEKKKVRDQMRRRKLDLEQQVLQRSLEVNEELYIKRLEMLKKQVEVDELLRYAKELFAEHSYTEAIDAANKALGIDASSSLAKSIKDDALYRLEEERILVSKKEAETQRAIQDMKRKQAEEIRKKREEDIAEHLTKGKDLFARNEFVDAIAEFKTVLKLDAQNMEAKLFIEQIRARLEKAKSALSESIEPDALQSDVQAGAVPLPAMSNSQPDEKSPASGPADAEHTLRKIPKTNLSIPVSGSGSDTLTKKEIPEASAAGAPLNAQAPSPTAAPLSNEPQALSSPGTTAIPAQENDTAKPEAIPVVPHQEQQQAPSAIPQTRSEAAPGSSSTAVAQQPRVTEPSATTTAAEPKAAVEQLLTPGEILKSSESK